MEFEPGARRDHRFALAQLAKSLLDRFDLLRHRQKIFHLIIFQDQDHEVFSVVCVQRRP